MIRCSSLYPHLNHLPGCEATYILSQAGLIKYVGTTTNLRRRMREHKLRNEKIVFDRTAILHYFDVYDLKLESDLQRELRPTLGTISIYQSLEALPLLIRDHYVKRIDKLIDEMPDSFDESLPYFEQVTGYHRLIEKLFPVNAEVRRRWEASTEMIARMAQSSEEVLV
ncbi:MAG: GIY-YIG nuclease family protein [Rivularia sp. (in: cyanobacteria)]